MSFDLDAARAVTLVNAGCPGIGDGTQPCHETHVVQAMLASACDEVERLRDQRVAEIVSRGDEVEMRALLTPERAAELSPRTLDWLTRVLHARPPSLVDLFVKCAACGKEWQHEMVGSDGKCVACVRAERDAANAKIARLVTVLQSIEWSGDETTSYESAACPSCGGWHPDARADRAEEQRERAAREDRFVGHAPDCDIYAALADAGKESK